MGESPESLPFRSLEFSGTPWTRWLWSIGIHAGAVLVLIAIPVTVERAIQPPNRIAAVSLSIPPPPRPVLKEVKAPVVIPPPVVERVRKVRFQPPPVKPVPAKTVTLTLPTVELPRLTETPKIDLPGASYIKPPVIKQEVFVASNSAPVSPEIPVPSIKTGGFGDKNGVPTNAASNNKGLTVPTLGAFDSPGGPLTKAGGGTGRAIASAGFGSAAVGSGGGYNHAPVQAGGFGDYKAATGTTPAVTTPGARSTAPMETPVEITFKPKPIYTLEARDKKIEGEVQLEVQFAATGQIHVLRVIRGLGFGLDESARTAAGQIRFHPGTRNGAPVDVTGTVHIVFELS